MGLLYCEKPTYNMKAKPEGQSRWLFLVLSLLTLCCFFFPLDNHIHQQCKKTIREWALWPFIEERTQMKAKSLLCFHMNVFIDIIHSASMQVFLHSHRFRKKIIAYFIKNYCILCQNCQLISLQHGIFTILIAYIILQFFLHFSFVMTNHIILNPSTHFTVLFLLYMHTRTHICTHTWTFCFLCYVCVCAMNGFNMQTHGAFYIASQN